METRTPPLWAPGVMFANIPIDLGPVSIEDATYCSPGAEHLAATPLEMALATASVIAWLCGCRLEVR